MEITYLTSEQNAAIELAESKLVSVNADIKKVQTILVQVKGNHVQYSKYQTLLAKLQARKNELLEIVNQ